jgi:membrane-bound metal-dependent hydrolase YbcI (DUF457 family)
MPTHWWEGRTARGGRRTGWRGAFVYISGLDNVTHTLFGWTLARSRTLRATPYATATLLLASNAPDADIVTAFTGGGLEYLAAHRGPTHGPLGFAGLGVLTALVVFVWARVAAWRAGHRLERPAALLWRLCLIGTAGVTLHALMDLPTSYGTRLLSPFLPTWYAFDWMPIVDIYLLGILAAGLLLARGRAAASQARIARAVLLLVVLDYTGRAVLHDRALADAAARSADGTASPCLSHPTLSRHPVAVDPSAPTTTCLQAAALPTFVSPFEFRVVRRYAGGYELSERNVLAGLPVRGFWIDAARGAAIDRALATRTGRVFLDFSRFPAAEVQVEPSGGTVVRVLDLRFMGTPLTLDANPQPRAPSAMTVRLAPDGRVVFEGLGG